MKDNILAIIAVALMVLAVYAFGQRGDNPPGLKDKIRFVQD